MKIISGCTRCLLALVLSLGLLAQAAPSTCRAAQAAKAGEQATKQKSTEITPMEEKEFAGVVELLAFADGFRLAAGGKPEKAVEKYFSPEALARWQKETWPLFSNAPLQLVDLFAGAVIWPGGMGMGRGLTAYYNPWSDLLFFTQWSKVDDKWVVVDYAYMTGESWRGEKFTNKSIVPLWTRQKAAPGLALGEYYRASLDVFNRLAPPFTPKPLSLADFTGLVSDKSKDFSVFLVRMRNRLRMFAGYFSPKAEPSVKSIRAQVGQLRKALAGGNSQKVQDLVARRQPQVMEDLFLIPEQIRRGLAENFAFKKGDQALVALVAPRWPMWFVLVHLSQSENQTQIEAVELLQFELVGVAAKALGMEVQ